MEVGRKHGREEDGELSFNASPPPSKKKSSLIVTPLKPSSSSFSQDDSADEVLLLHHLCLLEDLYCGHCDDGDSSISSNNSKSRDDLVSEMVRNLEHVLASNNDEMGSGENNASCGNITIGKMGSGESHSIRDKNDTIGDNENNTSDENNTGGEKCCGEVEFSDRKYRYGKLNIDESKGTKADADADAASSTTLDPLHYASFDDEDEALSSSSRSEEIDLKFLLHASDDELGIPPSPTPSPSPSLSLLQKEEQPPLDGSNKEGDNSSLLEILASMDSTFALDEDYMWNQQMNMESWILLDSRLCYSPL